MNPPEPPTASSVSHPRQVPLWPWLLALLCAAVGCSPNPFAGKPRLRVQDIRAVTFHASGQSWQATPAEISRLVSAYQQAEVRQDDLGTTPPASAEVLLKTGEMLQIWGGSDGIQGLWSRDGEVDLRGEMLGEMLAEVVARADQPGPPPPRLRDPPAM